MKGQPVQAHTPLLILITALAISPLVQAAPPPDSLITQDAPGQQRFLLNPMEGPGDIPVTGSWRMKKAKAVAVADQEPKLGTRALRFQGEAEIAGGKGDFSVAERPAGELFAAGLWVHLGADANVKKLGFQVYDGEGEVLMYSVPGDWTGWRWLEFNFEQAEFSQAYKQEDKNQKLDQPVRGLHLFWFTVEPGPSALTVDEHIGLSRIATGGPALNAKLFGEEAIEPGQAPELALLLENRTDEPRSVRVGRMVRPTSDLPALPLPHPVYGVNRAEGKPSHLVVNEVTVDKTTATDGNPYNGVDQSIDKPGYTEAFHTLDLQEPLTVRRITYRAGDANWIWKMDVSASLDGKTFTPVADLQGVNLHKRWDEQVVAVPNPFPARFVRLRYHRDGEAMTFLRTPTEIRIFDSVRPEDFTLPGGETPVFAGTVERTVPPRSFHWEPLPADPLPAGAHQSIVQVESGDLREWLVSTHFTMPPEMETLSPNSPFGMNASSFDLFDINRRLGVGWIRWENLKWQFVCKEPGRFAFDGSIGPWNVNQDEYMSEYKKRGMNVLSYTFHTPPWSTTAPEGTEKNRAGWPPKNYADYGEAMYQIAARYGTRTVPEDTLLTDDKKSGLGQVDAFQLWNEPNLVGPGWAPWVGSMNEYFELFRHGAEGVKRADPKAVVSHAGLAGIGVGLVDTLRTYTYADGKHPLDFTDLITVHYYSGRQNPEVATRDPNANRTGRPIEGQPTFPEQIRELTDWRDRYAPGKPVWVTETGNDVGGPMGLGEREQAAKLPRVTMLHLAAGVDKVFIYRERGSTAAQHAGAGLLRNDNSLRPSWFTMATLIRQFEGVDIKSALRLDVGDPNVWAYLWDRSGKPLLTAWTVEGTASLPVGSGRLVDSFGAETTIGGDTTVALSIFPVYLSDFTIDATWQARIDAATERERLRMESIKRDETRRAYLFDFGSTQHVGTLTLGTIRPYTAVMSTDQYDEQKGYGFQPGPALRDEVAHWIPDVRTKDNTRIRDNTTFRFKVAPGKYQLTFCASPMADQVNFTLQAGGEPIILPINPETPRTAHTYATDIEVTGTEAILGVEGMGNLCWLSLVQP